MLADVTQSCGVTPEIAQRIREDLYPSVRARGEKVRWVTRIAAEREDGACRDWPCALNNRGYGTVRWNGKQVKATHVILELTGRPRPHPKAFALHSCDRPACVAPWHLRWGTPADNSADAVARGRVAHNDGPANGLAKLTDADVLAIRAAKGKRTQRALAEDYGVHFTVINKILLGKTWRHLLPEESA